MTPLADTLTALDEQPLRTPAAAWPAGLNGLDRPGHCAWWVDEAGDRELSRSLRIELYRVLGVL